MSTRRPDDTKRRDHAHPGLLIDATNRCIWVAGRHELARYGVPVGKVVRIDWPGADAPNTVEGSE